ncbi:ACP phosphodiesterase [Chitinophaga sp. 22620]|uniref:acyl carrier protein phosphodiesterase n=1 Tax=Chitinophaga sp. 22620 TaxID=3453952 RepID=UPI003F842A59
MADYNYLRDTEKPRLTAIRRLLTINAAQQPMNYLAHAYLSFHDPAVTTGQMIADFVKGKQLYNYPEEIRRGIRLHRALDGFTDQHPATKAAKDIFRPTCGLYGGVFMDIVYDHFLANDKERFTLLSLAAFAESTYAIIQARHDELPPVFREVFHYMKSHNWLYNYRQRDGVLKSFTGMVRRSKYFPHPVEVPFGVFEDNYAALQECYDGFFPDAVAFMQLEGLKP